MTLLLIVAIIIAVIFSAFCVLSLHTMFLTKKETEESKSRIKQLEKNVDTVGRLVTSKTEELSRKIDEQGTVQKQTQEINKIEESSPGKAEEKTIDIEDTFEDTEEADRIEEIDDTIDLDDLFAQLEVAPAVQNESQPKPEHTDNLVVIGNENIPEEIENRHHKEYDVGKSGRKYTESELNMLIRE